MTGPKICIDGFNLAMDRGSGIATYARNLSGAVRSLGLESHILFGPERGLGDDALLNEIALFNAAPLASTSQRAASLLRDLLSLTPPHDHRAKRIALTGEVIPTQRLRNVPPCDGAWVSKDVFRAANRGYSAWGQFTGIHFGERSAAPPDVMHWTCPLPLRAKGLPNLYTIHDMVPLRLPYATLENKGRFLALCREICAKADRVVTVSEHSKTDITRILGVAAERVVVTYQSVDLPLGFAARTEEDVASEVEGVFGLGWRDYFIVFGAIEPKKNLARIIEAYLASSVAAPLVIIGGRAWLDDDETRLLYPDLVETSVVKDGRIRRADRVRRYDYLPLGLLMSLVRGAKATLMPSLYEGFGLPVLESMLLGTPVLASTAGSLPEIAGDAALLVDPYDAQAIRKAIKTLDADADLRGELAARGRTQAARFSPEAYARRLDDLYRPFV